MKDNETKIALFLSMIYGCIVWYHYLNYGMLHDGGLLNYSML